jgi:multidrug efflux pump subunit AcrA (membrane-fusion protein)
MTTLDPRTIAADLMTATARDLDTLDVLTHISQAYDVLTYPDSLPAEVLALVRTAGIDLIWPDDTRDTELDAQRVEVERLRSELAQVRAELERERRAHVCTERCRPNAHVAFQGRRRVTELEAELAAAEEQIASMRAALDADDAEAVTR